ncbi:hypothetical protein [Limosilactobacillus portuensis]|uniref:hypothetical protein n=1 Tax=Limosilactobacillus portuensis TaxID=2742601 RepID=UPI003267DC72
MLHTYRKTATIQAEQFDGSDEMIRKYDIRDHRMDGLTWFDLFTVKGAMEIDKGDWIIGNDGKYWTIPDDIFRQTYERCD